MDKPREVEEIKEYSGKTPVKMNQKKQNFDATYANSTDDDISEINISDESRDIEMACVEELKVPQKSKLRTRRKKINRENLKISRRSKAIKKVPKFNHNPPASQDKFNKQFQFFYSRTCFRGMIEYYKDLLKPIKGCNKDAK